MTQAFHLTQFKNGQTQYMSAVIATDNETEDQLAARAEKQAEKLEKRFGGFFEILTSEEVIKEGINYPRVGNTKELRLSETVFA